MLYDVIYKTLSLIVGEGLADLPISLTLFSDTPILTCTFAELLSMIGSAGIVIYLVAFFLWDPIKLCIRTVYRFKKK